MRLQLPAPAARVKGRYMVFNGADRKVVTEAELGKLLFRANQLRSVQERVARRSLALRARTRIGRSHPGNLPALGPKRKWYFYLGERQLLFCGPHSSRYSSHESLLAEDGNSAPNNRGQSQFSESDEESRGKTLRTIMRRQTV